MRLVFSLCAMCLVVAVGSAQEKKKKGNRSEQMDYGPFMGASYRIPNPKDNNVYRGLAVGFDIPAGERLQEAQAGYVFDQEMLRPAGFWTGGFVKYDGVVLSGSHGANPTPVGKVLLATKPTPGWAKDGDWKDPRPVTHGPLPRDWARYKGHYRHEDGTVFAYTVGDDLVLESPQLETIAEQKILSRNFTLGPTTKAQAFVVADVEGGKPLADKKVFGLESGDTLTLARVVGDLTGVLSTIEDGRIICTLMPSAKGGNLKVSVWVGPKANLEQGFAALGKVQAGTDLTTRTKGSKLLWNEVLKTKGKLDLNTSRNKVKNSAGSAYVFDSITPPFTNPWGAWMRIGGVDFFSDGRAAVSTWSGDVWIVSGIDDKLENVQWKRFATGIFQALGLKIVDDKIYVLGRDMITRLHDLNNDGEADFHECFNNDYMVTMNFHEFIFDLHTDPAGNFYFIKGGPVRPGGSGWDKIVPHHGCIFKVSKDGSKLDIVARGFRAPNGMGVSPTGQVTCGDNEGTWTPMCPINWVKPGGFYGVVDFADRPEPPKIRDNPLCWMPKNVDNSNGGQVWIDSDKFGPLSGQMLHESYGQSTLYHVLKEEVAGQMQGGVVPLLSFDSGVCRARFIKPQNALYVTGLRGWQTNASQDGGFYRVRYTGKAMNAPIGLNVTPGTIKLTFSDPLDTASANNPENFRIEQWNYKWTKGYGSPSFKVSEPAKTGKDELEIDSANVSNDGKTVTLKVDGLAPVMQMKITMRLKFADGSSLETDIHNTINVVGDKVGEVHVGEYKIVERK